MCEGPSEIVRRLRCERGFAVPTVMLAMLAVFGLGTATIVASVGAQQGTTRDQNSKTALAVAEAGVANAMLRYNRVRTDSGATADDCVPVGGGVPVSAGLPDAGWCPSTISATFDRGAYSYRVKPIAASGSTPALLTIVSTGTVDGVARRVKTTAASSAKGFRPFAEAGVIGLDHITLANGGGEIHGNVATNGSIHVGSNSKVYCDYAQVGQGGAFQPGTNTTITCPSTPDVLNLPPVNPGDVLTNNSNDRICALDPIQGTTCAGAWNPTARTLTLGAGAAITLGAAGGEFNYALCRVDLRSNSYLHVANGATVRIYLLSPDSAPCLNESQPLRLHSNSKIEPTGQDATSLQILVVGSATRPTSIALDSNSLLFSCDQTFVVYAPRTDVTMNSNTSICGGVAAKSVYVNSNIRLHSSEMADDWELPNQDVAAHYGKPEAFAECTAAPTNPPDAGC